ncbi:Putative alcohol dehydrogenase [Alloalcanivorax dieselolei B5]|uniref:Putative alcohol dehydrogenase n=1 Tax=Alcanivorax dieselolei (strain DSM 16502 / CGMCC 1.3690 / MCCC 1A00001 / B-5) TaxID=930169 RepID=K0CJ54_ALCDB|nr:DUF1116 domain-containing protein [Alloalcanivorax dieselolei]AFT72663.1 Putative alcohol dehydrogenase [Alloalcanivorax dieselolei B5]
MDAVESANRAALSKVRQVRPQWSGVAEARRVLPLPERTLLHAGPPFEDPRDPSPPILSSAVLCCLYEGWARNEEEAERLISAGRVRLLPAQDFSVVTPLAAVISPSTALVEISDAVEPGHRCWSLLGSGSGPQIRFGSRDPAILERLRWRDQVLAPALRKVLATRPIALLPLARLGLEAGDDLHAQTTHANQALCAAMPSTLPEEVRECLRNTPLFFLTLWMGACHLMLAAAAGETGSSLVLALTGNGRRVGIRIADEPALWRTHTAPVPEGPRISASVVPASPMVGDSGVIDAFGLGAQAWGRCSGVAEALAPWWPDPAAASGDWLVGAHPLFEDLHLPIGLARHRVTADTDLPRVAIAMVGGDGRAGLLGRGLCVPPAALFMG